MKAPETRPTVRGLAALGAVGLVVVAAAVTGTPELTPLAVVIGVPLVISPWLAHRRARRTLAAMEIHAHAEPGAGEVGCEMNVKLSFTNRSTRSPTLPPLGLPPMGGQWHARGADRRYSPRHRLLAPSVPALTAMPNPSSGRTESCMIPVPTGRRGVLELSSQRCWTHDPLGLFGAPGPSTPVVVGVVHPAPVRPSQPIVGLPSEMAGAAAPRASSSGSGLGDLEGIRPYVAGDRLSLLHWPAKARYGTWFVRQFGAEGTIAVPIVVDDRVGVHRRAEFDRLVSAVLWTLDEALGGGRAVHLLTLTGRSYPLEPTERGHAEARLVLAELQPVGMPSSAWVPSIPIDAIVVTTQTGSERLTHRPVTSAIPGVADDPVLPVMNATQVVVI